MPKLTDVVTIKTARVPNWLELEIKVDLEDGAGETQLPYTFDPTEDNEFARQVVAWLVEHKDVEVEQVEYAPLPYLLGKDTIFERMTEADAGHFETMLANSTAKFRIQFNSTTSFASDDALFAQLKAGLESVMTKTRVAALLKDT